MGVKPLKTIIAIVIIIIALVCLELFIPAPSIQCNFGNTVNITDGHRLQNGSIEFENVTYDERFYKNYDYVVDLKRVKVTVATHIRGCLCAVKNCVRKCKNYDDHDHVMVNNHENVEQKISIGKETDYHVMVHKPCDKMFALSDEEDEWLFYKNGSILVKGHGIMGTEHFCFSNYTNDDSKTVVHVCSDLTVDVDKDKVNISDTKRIVNLIAMSISFPFLLVTFLIYGWIPQLRNVHGKSLMSYVGSLIFLFVFLISVQLDKKMISGTMYCKLSGHISYFCAISCFFWLNVMCYDIWSTFKGRMRGFRKLADNKRFMVYFLYAFGSASVLTFILYLVDTIPGVPKKYQPIIGIERCWVRADRLVEFLYLYLPISIISTINIVLYSFTAYKIYKCQKEMASVRSEDSQKHSNMHEDKDRFYLYLRLFIIMGVTWTMESISWAFKNSLYLFIFTDALNCLQGFLIFFLFVWKPKVFELMKKRYHSTNWCCFKSKFDIPQNTTYSDVTTKTSSEESEVRGKFIIDDS